METSSQSPQRNNGYDYKEFKTRVKAMTHWERKAYLQELANEMTGVAAEMSRWYKIKGRILAQMRMLKSLLTPRVRRLTSKGFARYCVNGVLFHRAYPQGEPRDVKWVIVDQHSRTSTNYSFRFGGPICVVESLKARLGTAVQSYRYRGIQTSDIPTLVELLQEKDLQLLHLRARFDARQKARIAVTRNYKHFWFIRSLHGIPAEQIPKIVEGWYTYVPRKNRGTSEVRPYRGSFQND